MSIFSAEVLDALREQGRKTGRLGGLARAKSMTKEERRKSATKASRAAAKVRTQRAKLKRLAAQIDSGTKALSQQQSRLKGKKSSG